METTSINFIVGGAEYKFDDKYKAVSCRQCWLFSMYEWTYAFRKGLEVSEQRKKNKKQNTFIPIMLESHFVLRSQVL